MFPLGPMPELKTQAQALKLDIQRALNFPDGTDMRLVRPDASEVTKWAIIATLTEGWNRVGVSERGKGEGYTVIFQVADLTGQLRGWLDSEDESHATHVLVQEVYHEIDDVPEVAPDVAQVFNITCRTRKLVRAEE
jgi:hypothetical protein